MGNIEEYALEKIDMQLRYILKKLTQRQKWEKIFFERFTEPLHLNLLSLIFLLFGSYRQKIAFDLVIRQQHAYSILKCADYALACGLKQVTLIEFGVAAGAGLMNIALIAERVSKITGVQFRIWGFDTGMGMPTPCDYRDHPDLYQSGDFKMDYEALRARLPHNTQLLLGDIAHTVESYREKVSAESPIGFVSIDVDYYSSARTALKIFLDEPRKYLPITLVYFDDIFEEPHNHYCGELLAIDEFNRENRFRKLEHPAFLENRRIFKKAAWIKQIYFLHVLDHPQRTNTAKSVASRVIDNPYY